MLSKGLTGRGVHARQTGCWSGGALRPWVSTLMFRVVSRTGVRGGRCVIDSENPRYTTHLNNSLANPRLPVHASNVGSLGAAESRRYQACLSQLARLRFYS